MLVLQMLLLVRHKLQGLYSTSAHACGNAAGGRTAHRAVWPCLKLIELLVCPAGRVQQSW